LTQRETRITALEQEQATARTALAEMKANAEGRAGDVAAFRERIKDLEGKAAAMERTASALERAKEANTELHASVARMEASVTARNGLS